MQYDPDSALSYEGYARILQLQNRLLGIIFLLLCLLLLLALSIVVLSLTKRTEMFPVVIDKLTGRTEIIENDLSNISWDTITLLDNSHIHDYVIARERYTPAFIQTDHETATRYTCNQEVLTELQLRVDLDNPQNVFSLYGKGTVIPDIKAITYLRSTDDVPEDVAPSEQMRYYTVRFKRTINRAKSNNPQTINHQLIIGVNYSERAESAMKMRLNPLGFCVHSYNLTTITG